MNEAPEGAPGSGSRSTKDHPEQIPDAALLDYQDGVDEMPAGPAPATDDRHTALSELEQLPGGHSVGGPSDLLAASSAAHGSLKSVTAKELLTEDFQDPPYLIEGLWPAQAVGFLGGHPKDWKTWIALDIVLAIVFGGFGAFGLAFFSEHLNDNLEKAEDVEYHLNLPVLASIPQLER